MIFFMKREKLNALMKVIICLLSLMLLVRIISISSSAATSRSKVTPNDTAKYIIHKVDKGETLYSLSKQCSTSVDRLLELNPQIVNNNLKAGTEIRLPKEGDHSTRNDEYEGIGPKPFLTPTYYKVAQGETLYSIGKKTGNEVDVLKMWNDLKNNNIKTGQDIIVGYSEGNSVNTAKPEAGEETDIAENKTEETTPAVKTTAVTTKATHSTVKSASVKSTKAPAVVRNTADMSAPPTTSTTASPEKKNEKLVYKTERGLCEWTRGNSDNGKFYALHPSAPIGSTISVKNMMNNRSIQVKVIGHLPATPENENISIKISGSAAKKLGAIDEKFLVTLSYMGYETDKDVAIK
jgi:LysM repeat protein